jgi:SAM-dependent methyltransferase
MLVEAARGASRVAWREGDARTVDLGRRFELAVMTGHAFQVFLSDDDVRMLLANVRRHLEPGGRFAFETRNPSYRAWERWEAELSGSHVDARSAQRVDVDYSAIRTIEPDLVGFTTTFRWPDARRSAVSRSTLRFIDPERLRTLVEEGGFRIDGWFGDWDRRPVTASSPEVIVVAHRLAGRRNRQQSGSGIGRSR